MYPQLNIADPSLLPTLDDFFSPKRWYELYKESVDYRRSKVDPLWKEVINYTTANTNQFRRKVENEDLSYIVDIPHVKLNVERKVAALSGVTFVPILQSDVADLPNYQTIQQLILRWAWRTTRADSVLISMLPDLCKFGISIGNIGYDTDSLDGRGAPYARKKDITNFYFDPNRRHEDINVDCRWIFEVSVIPVEDARQTYPNYPFNNQGDSDGAFVGDNHLFGDELKIKNQKGYAHLVKCSIVRRINGKKRVFIGILDGIGGNWIVPPYDNGLGRYSYFCMTMPLNGGEAYPEPPVLAETGLSDLVNVGLSIYTDDAVRTGVPMWAVHEADDTAKRSLRDPNANKAGGVIEFSVQKPEPLLSPRQSKALDLAMVMEQKLSIVGNSQDVMVGEAPGGVKSGRAIQALQQTAATPMKNYSNSYYECAVMLATGIFQSCKKHMTDARFLPIDLGLQKMILPVNIAEESQAEAERYAGMAIPPDYTVETARVTKEDGSMVAVPRSEAMEIQLANPNAQIQLTVNDIAYGNAEVSVEVNVEMSPMDKQLLAQTDLQMGVIGPLTYLKARGYANYEQVYDEAVQHNQKMQYAALVEQDPVMNALANNPELRMTAAKVLNIALQSKEEKSKDKKS